MYPLSEWEGRTWEHLARGHVERTECSEVSTSIRRAQYFPSGLTKVSLKVFYRMTFKSSTFWNYVWTLTRRYYISIHKKSTRWTTLKMILHGKVFLSFFESQWQETLTNICCKTRLKIPFLLHLKFKFTVIVPILRKWYRAVWLRAWQLFPDRFLSTRPALHMSTFIVVFF